MDTVCLKMNTHFLKNKIPFQMKHPVITYILAILIFVSIDVSSGMPYQPAQAYSTTNVEDRPPVSGSPTTLQPSSTVGDLLASLFRQTIYNRIENLLLDPGRPSLEKQKIIDSAVQNYHNQQYSAPPHSNEEVHSVASNPKSTSTSILPDTISSKKFPRTDDEGFTIVSSQNANVNQGVDISTLAGKSMEASLLRLPFS